VGAGKQDARDTLDMRSISPAVYPSPASAASTRTRTQAQARASTRTQAHAHAHARKHEQAQARRQANPTREAHICHAACLHDHACRLARACVYGQEARQGRPRPSAAMRLPRSRGARHGHARGNAGVCVTRTNVHGEDYFPRLLPRQDGESNGAREEKQRRPCVFLLPRLCKRDMISAPHMHTCPRSSQRNRHLDYVRKDAATHEYCKRLLGHELPFAWWFRGRGQEEARQGGCPGDVPRPSFTRTGGVALTVAMKIPDGDQCKNKADAGDHPAWIPEL
jgi:hypothetical protein